MGAVTYAEPANYLQTMGAVTLSQEQVKVKAVGGKNHASSGQFSQILMIKIFFSFGELYHGI